MAMNPNSLKNLKPLKPGQSGNPGGRRRDFPKIETIMKENGVNVVDEILRILALLEDPREQVKIWLELLPYVHAKQDPRKYHEIQEDEFDRMSTAELISLARQHLLGAG